MARKIILNLAISLDGFIADPNGGFDWIKGDGDSSHDTLDKFNFEEFTNKIDAIVMGKKAFEGCPKETLDSFKSKTIYVASNDSLETPYDNVKMISGDIVKQITDLKDSEGEDIWLFGGGYLTDPFIKANVIDEFIIAHIPIILGKGIPLFHENNPTIELHLIKSTVQEGIVISTYVRR